MNDTEGFNLIKLKKGFTLAEILIVVTIVGIITFSVINLFSRERERVQYNEETIKVNSLVKLARNYASTNKPVYNGIDNIVPEEGYGIYFERSATPGQSRMILFANTSDATEKSAIQYDDADIVEEEFILAQEAIMEAISLTETSLPQVDVVDSALILFEITTASVSLYDNGDPSDIEAAAPIQYDELAVDFIRLGDDSQNSRKTFTIDEISGVPEMSL